MTKKNPEAAKLNVKAEKPADTRIDTQSLPFEVKEQTEALAAFLRQPYALHPETTGKGAKKTKKSLGSIKWGVYAFLDYDDEPIYVGQTKESLSTRIGRHLTGRRSDAVAKKILDPFEVCKVRVYPLPELQSRGGKDKEAKEILNALENKVFLDLLEKSQFKAVLNEQVPPAVEREVTIPDYVEARIVTDKVNEMRNHPDIRIARRAQTLADLAAGISERKVGLGIRKTLLTQAQRLESLARRRAGEAPDEGPPEEQDEKKAREE